MPAKGKRSMDVPPKRCVYCGEPYFKLAKLTFAGWERQVYCSQACMGAHMRTGWEDRHRYVRRGAGPCEPRARLVVREALGAIPPGAVVHHINNDNSDDRIENLYLFRSHAEHVSFHQRQRWAQARKDWTQAA